MFALEPDLKTQRGEWRYITLSLSSALDVGGGSTPLPRSFDPENDPVTIVWVAGWSSAPVRMHAEELAFTGIRFLTVQPLANRCTD